MSSLPLQVALLTTCSLVVVSSCGSVETDKVRDAKQERVAYRGPAPQRDLPTIKDKSVEAKPFVQKSDQQCRHDYRTMAQLDVTCIALRPRSEVFKIIERPDPLYMDEHPKGPAYDHYWFGWVYYEKGVLKSVTYNYSTVPKDYPWRPEALEHIGLQKTSEPYDYGFVVGWGKDSKLLECCGLRIETAGMLKSIPQITIRFDSRTKPGATR